MITEDNKKQIIRIVLIFIGLYLLAEFLRPGAGSGTQKMTMSIISGVARIIAILLAITVHEFAHAIVSYKLGDPTPKIQNRLSLNPIRHLDPIGTLALLIFRFGWGKPVEIDPRYYKNKEHGEMLVSVAGVITNVAFAFIGKIVLEFFGMINPMAIKGEFLIYTYLFFKYFLNYFIFINLILAVFNFLPIHPLDGFKFFHYISPRSIQDILIKLKPHGFIILLILIISDLLQKIIFPIINGINLFLDKIVNIIV